MKSLILGIGIFIVYMFMLGYGIAAFYPSPEYNDYCSGDRFIGKPLYPDGTVRGNCTFNPEIQQQEQQCYSQEGMPTYNYSEQGCPIAVNCDFCNKEYQEARISYEKNVFVIALIAGLITLFLGYGILSVEPVGSALMASGIGAIFYGSARNWDNLSDIWRFLLLLVALVLLIWIAMRLNKGLREEKYQRKKRK